MKMNPAGKDNLIEESLKICRKAFSYAFLFSFVINILMLSTSFYSLQVLDRVLSSYSYETLTMLSVIMLVVYVILAIIQIIRSHVFLGISNWLDNRLAPILLKNSISYEAKSLGSQDLRDLTTVRNFITGQSFTHLFDAPWSIIYFIVIFMIHWINGIITVFGALILLILAVINEMYTKEHFASANEKNLISMKQVDSISRNAEVIKAMGMKGNLVKRWMEVNDKVQNSNTEASRRSNLISHTTKSIRLLIQMVTMAVSAVLVMKAEMSAGGIIATSILAGRALAPYDAAMSLYRGLISARKSYDRLKQNVNNIAANEEEKIELPEIKGDLAIESVVYSSGKGGDLILKGITAKINAGELIGLIGPSGSGKTSLARAITGVITPSKGIIRIDSANLHQRDSESLGPNIGYLPQDIELFDGTVKENIARMNPEAADEDIVKAAQFANVHELILKLPKGYETQIGDRAAKLSAGQRQRIALARAFFGMPKLVVLDEPNSNLDIEGEMSLAATLANAKKAAITTIVISHRMGLLDKVDRIMVLHDGELKMFDKADVVIKKLSGKK